MDGIILNIQYAIYWLEEAITEAQLNDTTYHPDYKKNVKKLKVLKKMLHQAEKLNKI